uniref:Uncharacterized protein n=1 Tax=Arundo donax TaxID=35708 RepID=A0A0A9CH16_ARUDO
MALDVERNIRKPT